MRNIEDEIRGIVLSSPKGWSAKISRNKEYIEFLNLKFPMLSDPFYKLSTKIYWFMNGFVDFPICPTCEKSDNYKLKNVDFGGYPGHCCCRCTQLDSEVRRKNSETNMKLYGVSNGAQSEKSRMKYKKHCQEKWGVDNAFQAKEIKDKIKEVVRERYGCDNPMQNIDIRAKARRTLIELYGVDSPVRLVTHINRSVGEIELYEYIQMLFSEYSVESSNTSELGGMELDIWIPKLRIGIEYDGDYWHSLPEMVKRDKMKDEICQRKSVQLYRVKECDWVNNKCDVKEFFEQLKRGINKDGNQ